MSIKDIEKILQGTFESLDDRAYWEEKLQQARQKEKTAAENEKFYNKMIVYDRYGGVKWKI